MRRSELARRPAKRPKLGVQCSEQAITAPQVPPVDQMVKHSLIVLGEFEAFLDRTRRMIRLETEIPKASNYSANALSGRRGDISGEG